MEGLNKKLVKGARKTRKLSPRFQAVFPNSAESELVKRVAERHSNVSNFLRIAAIEKAKKMEALGL